MLERSALRIGPFRTGPKGRYRVVHDAVTSQVLGHAIRTQRWGFLAPRTDVVYEEPDGSLLATVRRTWWLTESTVVDADNDPVALVCRRQLEWPDERVMAEIVTLDRNRGEFHAAVGVELANWSTQGDCLLLTFHPRVAYEPLVKMAILAAVLMRY
jgi:hypothetical protein